jgi:coenzyme Q-binding protein COQ10
MLTFHIKFEFRSRLLESLVGALFDEAASRMVAAFERRAKRLYRICRSGAIRPGDHPEPLPG